MEATNLKKAGILSLVLMLTFIGSWEIFWRSKGFKITYNDDVALWAVKRTKAYLPVNEATVFIGSSRIKFDIDIPTWEFIAGEKTVQLALVGTSPRKMLEYFANDVKFKGKLLLDVTEGLFYSRFPWANQSAIDAIKYYQNYSPSQKASAYINYGLESIFVFLEHRRFGLNELLRGVPLSKRAGVMVEPPFPKEFEWTTYDRQTYMAPKFLSDTNLQKRQTAIWAEFGALDKTPAISGDSLLMIFKEVKNNIDKIKSRGGQIAFIRPPSSGPWLQAETEVYPRKKYWDDMLAYTNTIGIHFQDYPETSSFICPEWSHLALNDAIIYTKHLVKTLEAKGWAFPNKLTTALNKINTKTFNHGF
ncbi:MAG: hypothetical protein H0W75_01950 [Chitinophagaceae bacterium]|nr:hypothetical protein [Chitinophagaceae bacterium]